MNKPIRVIDSEFNLLGEIDGYQYLRMVRYYSEQGMFEMKINKHLVDESLIAKDNIIYIDEKRAGIIDSKEIAMDKGGKKSEIWLIKGKTLEVILERRIFLDAQYVYSGDILDCYTDILNKNFINPEDEERKIDNIIVDNQKSVDKVVDFVEKEQSNILFRLFDLAKETGVSFRVDLDLTAKKFKVVIYNGVVKTSGQSLVDPVIFAQSFNNLKDSRYTEDNTQEKSYVKVVAGSGMVNSVDKGLTGYNRKEVRLDGGTADTMEILANLGNMYLGKKITKRTLEGDILNTDPFMIDRDFNLGDTVTVMNKGWDLILNTDITGIEEVWDKGGYDIKVTFGEKVPNLIDKLKELF